MFDYAAFGQNIKKRRLELSLSLERLAEIIGISSKHLGQIERGKAKTSACTAIKILNVLQITFLDCENDRTDKIYSLYKSDRCQSEIRKAIAFNSKLLGERIRKLRKQRGLTQTELGSQLGISQSYITDLENGYCMGGNLAIISKIADFFDTTLDTLFYDNLLYYNPKNLIRIIANARESQNKTG